ncbi:unnamed protein product [Rotaria sp. Silwood1]|nr:unnamed protein product [Rotaria sp. Silwood1]CAF1211044.1 unnamed protein product [Rotaria sp. Silwood1]
MIMMLGLLYILACCFVSIHGHGYLLDPVARSSAWLVDQSFKQCCTYPNHMEMFCGGTQHQWNVHGGKCGICGESYDRPVKVFEKGGAMYTGKIVKTYNQGQQIDVTVVLTANHKGYFEFRLCNLDNNPNSDATQECLDRRLLKIAGTDSTKFRDVDKYGSQAITVRVQLPSDVACRHCVFQWKYTTGNSWGTDPVTGQSGLGMGIENETFMGCSDISIVSNGSPTQTEPPIVVPTEGPPTTARPSPPPQPTTTNAPPPSGSTTWSSNGVQYKTGDIVLYQGAKFQCIHDHTSFLGAEPGILTWAWWKPIN